MKRILISLGILINMNATELKVNVLDEVEIKSSSSLLSSNLTFKILCIDGYKWLQFGGDTHGSVSQIFEAKYINAFADAAVPVKCKNK